jgi:hypothetical protein
MIRVTTAFFIAFLGFAQQAHARCQPGEEQACFANGQESVRVCNDLGVFGPCLVEPPPPPPSGTVQPKYKVLTVIYSPPGNAGGGGTSAVTYGSGSSAGTTTSSSHAIKQAYSVSAALKSAILGGSGVALSFGYSRNTADASSVDIQKTASTQMSQFGPSIDGLDHDRDQIWLWLGPKVNMTLTTASSIEWALDSTSVIDLQFVFAGHLKNPTLMPPGVKARLDAYGITTADYAEILKADPFALGNVPVDPARYTALNTTFPYEPPFASGDTSPTLTTAVTYSTANTTTSSSTNEYSVGMTATGTVNLPLLLKTALKIDNSWTWTDATSHTTAVGSTESASVSIGGPAFGYTGPTDVAVYYDRLYKTFLFTFVPGLTAGLHGVVISESNASVVGKEVVVVVDGISHRTFTNAAGEFHVPASTAVTVQVQFDHSPSRTAGSREPLVITVP